MMQMSLFEARTVPERVGHASAKAIETTHILTPGKGRTSGYDFTLNPYRGCSFGCAYCYAAFFVGDEAKREDWGNWVEAKVRAAEVLASQDLHGKRVFMSSVTDPYQPLEAKLELTRSVLQVLLDRGVRLVVQTRSPLVLRDIDLLRRFEHVRVNVSITTDDDKVRQRFEPGCASIERRLDTVRTLKDAGIPVGVCVAPLLPMRDPAAFGRTLHELDPDKASAAWFHFSQKAFVSGTREEAVRLLRKYAWTQLDYERCVTEIRRRFSRFDDRGDAFVPV